jgi:hypothetical protein
VAFTPSGSGTAAQVTKGTALSEGETHWVLWASADSTSGPFYEIAETAVGTTTYDDSAAPSTYSASTSGVAKLAGTFSTLPSTKFCVTVDNKVLFAGAYESGVNASRVWMTPTLGSLGRGDDERYLNTTEVKGYIDVEEGNGGIITALAILAGQAIVFKERQIWRFVATGDPVAPFTPRNISRSVGCINHRTVAAGVDDLGNPCLYFAAQDGPYRLGVNGLEYLGFDVEDVWATRSSNTAFGVFYGQKHQYYLAIASTSGNYVRLRFNRKLGRVVDGVIRGGWMKDSGTTLLQFQRGMALVPYSPGLTGEQTYVPRPHVLDTSGVVHRADDIYDDNGTAYSAYVETVPQLPAGPLVKFTTGVPGVIAYTDTSTQTLTVSQRKNYNTSSSDVTVSLNTTRRHLRVEEGGIPGAGDMDAIAFRVGDTGVTDNTWTVDALVVPWSPQEALTDL